MFGLVWLDLVIPSFNQCLELVKKFTVVGGGGVKSNLGVHLGPNLKTRTLLRSRPKLNKNLNKF